MLCPELYNRMVKQLGETEIHDENRAESPGVTYPGQLNGVPVVAGESNGEYYAANCFAGETLVATPSGDQPISSLVGTATLLVPNKKGLGHWKDVPVRSFGIQPLLTVRLKFRRAIKTVRATPEHRWITSGRNGVYGQKVTKDLLPGDRLSSCHARSLSSYGVHQPNVSSVGVMQGFTFGDGSIGTVDNYPAHVEIYGKNKMTAMRPYFRACRSGYSGKGRGRHMRVSDLPRSWKQLPNTAESMSFLLGWLAGYFAADGSVQTNGSQATITSAVVGNLQRVKGICYVLGIRAAQIRPVTRSSGGCAPASVGNPLYSLSFSVRDVPSSFFIRRDHRQRVLKHLHQTQARARDVWQVVDVTDHGDREEVFCATVEGVEKFTLADNLMTMNCPFCGDRRKRLYVSYNFAKNKYKAVCYNETQCLTGMYGEGKSNRERLTQILLGGGGNFEPNEALAVRTPPTLSKEPPPYPGRVVRLSELPYDHFANRYLREQRGFDPVFLESQYNVGFITDTLDRFERIGNQLFIPIYMHGRLVGWQARPAMELDWKAANVRKYYNLPDMKKKLMLYGYDAAAAYPFAVLVEGVTDVWAVGPPAIASLGVSISDEQIKLIMEKWKKLIVYVDGDTLIPKRKGIRSAHQVLMDKLKPAADKYGLEVVPIFLPDNLDPGKMTRDQNLVYLSEKLEQINLLRTGGRL